MTKPQKESFWDTAHKRLDEVYQKLAIGVEVFLNLEGLTEMERQGALEELADYEVKVTGAKNHSTDQLTALDKIRNPKETGTIPKQTQFTSTRGGGR